MSFSISNLFIFLFQNCLSFQEKQSIIHVSRWFNQVTIILFKYTQKINLSYHPQGALGGGGDGVVVYWFEIHLTSEMLVDSMNMRLMRFIKH